VPSSADTEVVAAHARGGQCQSPADDGLEMGELPPARGSVCCSGGHALFEPRLDNVMFSWCEASTVFATERPLFDDVGRRLPAGSTEERR
jgi:hypothetical protein